MKTSKAMLTVITGALLAGCGAIGEVGGGSTEGARVKASGLPDMYKLVFVSYVLADNTRDPSNANDAGDRPDFAAALGDAYGSFTPVRDNQQQGSWNYAVPLARALGYWTAGVTIVFSDRSVNILGITAKLDWWAQDQVTFTRAEVTGSSAFDIATRCASMKANGLSSLRVRFVKVDESSASNQYYGCLMRGAGDAYASPDPAFRADANKALAYCIGNAGANTFCHDELELSADGSTISHNGECLPCSTNAVPDSEKFGCAATQPAAPAAAAPDFCPATCGPGTICNVQDHTCHDLPMNECDLIATTSGCPAAKPVCERRTTDHPTIPHGQPNHDVVYGVCVTEQPAPAATGPSCGGTCPRGQYCMSDHCATDYNHSHYECTALDAACTYAGAAGKCKAASRTDSAHPASDPNHTVEIYKCEVTGTIAESDRGMENYCAALAAQGRKCKHLEGGCTSNAQCETGLICLEDKRWILEPNYRPVRYCWDPSFCQKKIAAGNGTCGRLEGGCRSDAECGEGMECSDLGGAMGTRIPRFCLARPTGGAQQPVTDNGGAQQPVYNGGAVQPVDNGGGTAPAAQGNCLNGTAGSDRYSVDGVLYECWKLEEGWAQVWRDGAWQKWNRTPVDGPNCHGWLSNTKGNSLAYQYCRPGGAAPASNGAFLTVDDASIDVSGGCSVAPAAGAPTGLGMLLLLGLLGCARRRR
jgi:hypothetical protein